MLLVEGMGWFCRRVVGVVRWVLICLMMFRWVIERRRRWVGLFRVV